MLRLCDTLTVRPLIPRMHESLQPLRGFQRDQKASNAILLTAPSGFKYELALFDEPLSVIRWRLWKDDSVHALHDTHNVRWSSQPIKVRECRQVSDTKLELKHGNLLVELDYDGPPHLTVYKTKPFHDQARTSGAIAGAADLLLRRSPRHILGEYPKPKIMYKDLSHQSLTVTETGIAQYSLLHPLDAVHFGLGEKAAPLDLTKRKFTLGATDAANYDAFQTDPLYKHHPLLFTVPRPPAANIDTEAPPPDSRGLPTPPNPDANGEGFAILQFHNTNSDGEWDLGRMTNEPLGRFKKFTTARGGLECFLIFGKDVAQISDVYAQLVGPPRLPSRHWMGFLASTMALADSEDPPAQTLLEQFPVKCREEDIPCSVMHLSSGYTVSMKEPKNRYVFELNLKRYPDFAGMVKTYHQSGIKVSPNVKPFVLQSHPCFPKLLRDGAFFIDPDTDTAATTRIWSAQPGETETGCWLDMTSPAARQWWYDGCLKLAQAGCDSIWNDNNEFSLASDHYLAAGDIDGHYQGSKRPVGDIGRLMNCNIMAEESHKALQAVAPDRRTMVLTRSANVGTMHYATSTWSGDNYTSWETIQGNVAMGLQAGMALMHNYGHDIGGFGGPLPTVEMFVRWVQIGIWNPRFCIHSFKPDLTNLAGPGKSNTPWMYPEVTPIIRQSIKRRYELIPYLYSLHWESQRHATPPNAWVGWGSYEGDPGCFDVSSLASTSFWVGVGRVLVAGAFSAGQRQITVYLPRDKGLDPALDFFFEIGSGGIHMAGVTVVVKAPIERIAVFVHVGAALPIGKPCVTVTARDGTARTSIDGVAADIRENGGVVDYDDWRGLEIYPPNGGPATSQTYHTEWTEDDGESSSFAVARIAVDYRVEGDQIVVSAGWLEMDFTPLWYRLWIILPPGQTRRVHGSTEMSMHKGELCYAVKVDASFHSLQSNPGTYPHEKSDSSKDVSCDVV